MQGFRRTRQKRSSNRNRPTACYQHVHLPHDSAIAARLANRVRDRRRNRQLHWEPRTEGIELRLTVEGQENAERIACDEEEHPSYQPHTGAG